MREDPPPWKRWIMAARIHTLPAAASPVIVGSAMAYRDGIFAVGPATLALFGALLIQIATNFANDYFDARKGVDSRERHGFTRVTASGLVSPVTVKRAMYATFGVSVLIGIPLVYIGGVPIFIVGLTGLFMGYAYAGGPLPYGSIGLGDFMVFLYFGIFAVSGTYYVQASRWLGGGFPLTIQPGTLSTDVLIASLAPASLSTAILVVNNIRDMESDREAGKRTLAVMLGYTGSRIEYSILMGIAFLVPIVLMLSPREGYWMGLPLVSLLYAIVPLYSVWTDSGGSTLNKTLSRTGILLFIHSALMSLGLVL